MSKKSFSSFTLILIILVGSLGFIEVDGIDTGPINPAYFENSIPISITLNFWGFSSSFIPLALNLPETVVQQTINERTDEVEQYAAYIFGYPFAWKYNIQYELNTDPEPFSNIVDFFNNNSETIQTDAKINGSISSITGKGMEISKMADFLREFDADDGYTIHIIDGMQFSQNPENYYWYYSEVRNDYYENSGDLRNLGGISSTSLFYDVNAFAPAFADSKNGSQRMLDTTNSTYSVNDFIEDRLTTIIEQIVLGSPYSRQFSFVTFSSLPKLHFAKIIVGGNNSLTETYQIHTVSGDNGFEQNLRSFFSFYPETLEIIEDYTFLNDNKALQNFIETNVVIINGTRSIIMDSSKAEELKNAVRLDKSIYSSFPSGFFFLSLIFNLKGDEYIQFLVNTTKGLRQYSADYIGLDIVDILFWNNLGGSERLSIELSDYALRSFGKMLGLPLLVSGVPAFLETPMSDFGLGKSSNGKSFTEVERLGFFRKLMVWYNISSVLLYNSVIGKLQRQKIGFIPHEELFIAEARRVNATISWHKGKYVEAVKEYLIAFVNMSNAVRTVEKRISALSNSIVWSAGVFFLFALHNLMMTYVKRTREDVKRTKQGIPISWYRKD